MKKIPAFDGPSHIVSQYYGEYNSKKDEILSYHFHASDLAWNMHSFGPNSIQVTAQWKFIVSIIIKYE